MFFVTHFPYPTVKNTVLCPRGIALFRRTCVRFVWISQHHVNYFVVHRFIARFKALIKNRHRRTQFPQNDVYQFHLIGRKLLNGLHVLFHNGQIFLVLSPNGQNLLIFSLRQQRFNGFLYLRKRPINIAHFKF